MSSRLSGYALLACLIAASATTSAEAATFTVTSTTPIATSGGCDADCSLHDAIVAANATTAADIIEFNISGTGVKTITLDADGLPAITRPVTINGYTQTGAAVNTAANGSNAVLTVALTRSNPDPINDTLTTALNFSANAVGSVVRGIAFVQMGATTVAFITTDADNVVIDGNFFGTNAAGDADGGQAPGVAINVQAGANNTTIGGATAAARNVFAGIEQGIALFGTNAVIHSNTFGLEDNGTTALALADVAILTSGDGHEIGGTAANQSNVFANIESHAVQISNSSQGNTILGNSFRSSNDGLAINLQAAGDPLNGVTPNDGTDADTGANNLQNFPEILSAVRSGTSTNVTFNLFSTANRTFRVALYGNDTADPSGFGAGDRFLQTIDVTTNASGFVPSIVTVTGSGLPAGDFVTATATDLTTGETSEFSAAVMVGQTLTVNAVDDTTDGVCNSTHCSLREAILATNADTALDKINFAIPGTGPHTIVAGVSGLPDVVAPVEIDGGSQAGASENTQTGAGNDAVRMIVLSAPSVVSLGELLVFAPGSDGSTIRDIAFKDLDTDGGNMLSIEANEVRVLGCSFGVDASGNGDGGTSGFAALSVAGDSNNIGGTSPGSRLQFGGLSSALSLSGDQNTITNITVGLSAAGTPTLPVTGGTAILVTGFDNTFSALDSAPNRIVGNAGKGIRIAQNRTGNRIIATLFEGNGGIGIDLEASGDPSSGVTPNDVNDADNGANGLQNHPVITFAERNPDGTGTIQGTLATNPVNGTGYAVELFHSATAHPSGSGEGATRLGSVSVTVNGAGIGTFAFNPSGLPVSGFITALATRNTGSRDTSEFSPAVALVNAPIVVTNTNNSGAGSLNQAILTANGQLGTDRIHFAIAGPGPHRIDVGASGLPEITDTVDINGYTQSGSVANSSVNGFNGTIRVEIMAVAPGNLDRVLEFVGGANGSRIRGLSVFRVGGSTASGGIVISDASGVWVDGNLIGVTADGITGEGFGPAVEFEQTAPNGLIGGSALAERNLFANNRAVALLSGDDASVFGNLVGRRLDGSLQPAPGNVAIFVAAERAVIGGAQDRRNVLERHAVGVQVFSGSAEITRNVITEVGAFAIDVDANGPTPNDPDDTDTGPNGLQNHPVITSAAVNGAQTQLAGRLDSTPNATFRIEWFRAIETSLGLAQANEFLGETSATTDANGDATFSFSVSQALPIGSLVTATATATATVPGVTSELAPPEVVTGLDFIVNSTNDMNDGTCNVSHCSLREALLAANANTDASRIRFSIPGVGPTFTIIPQTTLPAITAPLVLDGYSQPGALPNTNLEPPNNAVIKIVLDGSSIAGLSNNPPMLAPQASDIEIRGLSIVGLEDGSIGNEAIDSPTNVNIDTANIRIRGNYIGLLPDGITADGNHVGIDLGGDSSADADNQIGGTLPEHQNVISGNGLHGISGSAPGLLVQNNLIGLARDGVTARGNGGKGLQLSSALGALLVDNRIAHNEDGVVVTSGGRGIELIDNEIHDNLDLGIDLGNDGVTANDALDADVGANNLTNKPDLVITGSNGQQRQIELTLSARPSTTYRISYFGERNCDQNGLAEGEVALTVANVSTDVGGTATGNRSLVLPSGFNEVTATATDLSTSETSEFSACAITLSDTVFANSFE